MPKVLITGGSGSLGKALLACPAAMPEGDIHVTWHKSRSEWPFDRSHQVDLGDFDAVDKLMASLQPDLVIHTACGTTNLDRDIVKATRHVAASCSEYEAALVHISSDALFDGKESPYTEAGRPTPLYPYAIAKADAEDLIKKYCPLAAIVRTSLLISLAEPNPSSAWIVKAMQEEREIDLFVDEIRCPVGVDDLARGLWRLARLLLDHQMEGAGMWNMVGPEAISRYALGLLLAQYYGLSAKYIRPVRSIDSGELRPRDVRLLNNRAEQQLDFFPRTASELLCGRDFV